MQVRVQAQKNGRLGSISMAMRIVSKHGVLALWQGLGSELLKACLSSAILFASKEKTQELADKLFGKK